MKFRRDPPPLDSLTESEADVELARALQALAQDRPSPEELERVRQRLEATLSQQTAARAQATLLQPVAGLVVIGAALLSLVSAVARIAPESHARTSGEKAAATSGLVANGQADRTNAPAVIEPASTSGESKESVSPTLTPPEQDHVTQTARPSLGESEQRAQRLPRGRRLPKPAPESQPRVGRALLPAAGSATEQAAAAQRTAGDRTSGSSAQSDNTPQKAATAPGDNASREHKAEKIASAQTAFASEERASAASRRPARDRDVVAAADPQEFAPKARGTLDEVMLLQRARKRALDEPQAALHWLDEHKRLFPRGMLSQEREVLAIQLLRALSQERAAQQRVEAFRQTFPGSIYLPRLAGEKSRD